MTKQNDVSNHLTYLDPQQIYVTAGEFARVIGMSPLTVSVWCKEGKIQSYRPVVVGNRRPKYRIPVSELQKFLHGDGDDSNGKTKTNNN